MLVASYLQNRRFRCNQKKTIEGTCPIREDSQTLSRLNVVVYELGRICRIFCPLVVPVWSVPEQSRFCNVNVKKPEVSTFNWDGLMIRTITPQFVVRRPLDPVEKEIQSAILKQAPAWPCRSRFRASRSTRREEMIHLGMTASFD